MATIETSEVFAEGGPQMWDLAIDEQKQFALTASNLGLQLIDLASRDSLFHFENREEGCHLVSYLGESCFAVALRDGGLKIFDARKQDYISRLKVHMPPEEQHGIYGFGVFANRLLTVGESQKGILWDITDKAAPRQLTEWQTGFSITYAAAFGEKYILLAHDDGAVSCLDVEAGVTIWHATCHEAGLLDIGTDGKRVVTAGKDGTSCVLDAWSGKVIAHLDGHGEDVNAAVLLDNLVLTADNDFPHLYRLWDWTNGDLLCEAETTGRFMPLRFRRLDKQLVLAAGQSQMGVQDNLEFQGPAAALHVLKITA